MKFTRMIGVAASTAIFAAAIPAMAHPRLVSSTPAANAVVSNVTQVTLSFSEGLVPQMSGIDLTMTAMPGMAGHKPMKVAGFKTAVASDGKTLTAALPRRLPAGSYRLDWHVVSVDTHRVAGNLAFTVK